MSRISDKKLEMEWSKSSLYLGYFLFTGLEALFAPQHTDFSAEQLLALVEKPLIIV